MTAWTTSEGVEERNDYEQRDFSAAVPSRLLIYPLYKKKKKVEGEVFDTFAEP